MHNVKSILIGLLIGIFILFTLAISVSIIYEDEVSQYLVEELNEYILSEIEVDDVNFSMIKKFPKATLELKNVIAKSKSGYFKEISGLNTDTLFYAKSIFIQLNLFDIITKKYNITSIHFDHGKINLFIDRFGDQNYIFWDRSLKDESADFNLELKQVRITNSDVLFCNEATNFVLQTDVKRMDFRGNFSNQNYLMKINSDLFVKALEIEKTRYIDNKSLNTDFNLDIINNQIQINNGFLKLENLKFNVNGNIEKTDNQNIDLMISGKKLNLKSFISNLPQVVKNEFPNISAQKGEVTLNLSIAGENIKSNSPHIDAMFLIHNAQLFDEERMLRFSNINVDGEFTNGNYNRSSTSKLLFKEFQVNLERNYFSGFFELNNLNDPQIKFDINSQLYFDEIKNILELDTLETFNGNASAEIKYNGSYRELRSFKFPDLFTKEYEINLKLSNGEIKVQNNPIHIKDLSGKFELKRTLYADSLAFKINDNDFLIDGRVSKLFEYFNEKQVFNVNAKLTSRKLNLNQLSAIFKVNKNQEINSSYHFPDKIALQLRLNIQNFEVGKFNATNIKGNLNYKPRMFSLHEVSFNSMNGNVKAGGVIIQKFNNDFLVRTQSRLNNININKLFYSFNNFGQEFITNQNLEGKLTGDVYFTSEWSDKLEINKKTVSSDCDFVLNEGELNDFEPMLALSRFIEVDELKNIKFSTIENKITIKNEQIIVPQMDIKSSAIDVTASGEHNFDNTYSYHVKLLLSDLLSGKVKKSRRKNRTQENIEEDEEGRIILYLLLTGDKEDFKVKYDRKAARSVRKENMKTERNDLKKILNEEFGWFKKDSAVFIDSSAKKDEEKFKVEFEENNKNTKKKTEEQIPEQRFEIEWDEDTIDNG